VRAWLPGALVVVALEVSHAGATGVVVQARHADGSPSSREVLVGGRRHGMYRTWWTNGRLRTEARYREGWYHGEYRTWREDGRPYERRHYENGREVGLQQSWDERGALYLNYEVRDGRRYGFVNAYPCVSASMSGTRSPGARP